MPAGGSDQVACYRPNQRHDLGLLRTWAVMARNVVASRGLIWQLFKRDFLAQYKKSFIGATWIFIAPVAAILGRLFLKMTGVLDPGETGTPYAVYLLVGTSMWTLFMGFFQAASQTLTAGASFIMQVRYPHEALLFKQVGQRLAHFSIAFLVNLVVIFAFGLVPSWKMVLLPAVALPMFLLGAGAGLFFSMLAVVAVDVRRFANMGLGFVMYLTPVIYSSEVDNRFIQAVIRWNPLTYLVCSARDIILDGRLYGGHFGTAGFAAASALGLVVFLASWRLFFLAEDKLVERML